MTSSIIPPRNISDKFTIIWDLCRFLQPGLISSTIFCKKLDFPTANHNRYKKLHWAQFPMIHLELKLLKNPFWYNNKVTKENNKEIQSSLIKRFTSQEIYLPLRNIIFSVLISGVKLLVIHNWFKKCWWIAILYVYFLSCINLFISLPLNPAVHRMGIAPNIVSWM